MCQQSKPLQTKHKRQKQNMHRLAGRSKGIVCWDQNLEVRRDVPEFISFGTMELTAPLVKDVTRAELTVQTDEWDGN